MRNTIRNTHLLSPYVASVQAIALICCFVALFFSCEEETPKSADKKIDQLVLTVGGTDTPVTFDADYNAALTVPFGTDLAAITVKTLQVSAKATASVAPGDVLTITGGSAMLTVTAEDGSKQGYTVGFTPTPPRTGVELTALTVTIAGQTYSTTGDDDAVVLTDNTIAITLPFGITLPTSLPLTVLTLSTGASSVPAEGATLDLTAGVGTINVTAEDGTTTGVYTVRVTVALPHTGTDITALTVTIAGVAYSNMDDNLLVTITDNTIVIILPFGIGVTTFPASLSLTGLTLSAGASSVPAEGAALELSGTGVGMISVQAEDPSVAAFSYMVSATIFGQPVVTTYTGTDTLGIAVRDVVESGRSVSFAAMDTVIAVSALADVSFDWALGTLTGTKMATAGTLVLTQSDLAMFPATADATYALTVSANGETSEEKTLFYYPGQVRTWRDLQGVRVDLAGTYRMMRDIAFPDEDGDGVSEYNFEPVGRDTDANTDNFQGDTFSGTFDGVSRVVNNFYINRSTEDYVGLFGRLTGTVRNVGLAGGMVTGNGAVGGLVGSNSSGTIQGVYAKVAVTGNRDNVGGLVGSNNSGTIQGVYATGAVTGNNSVGGLVGTNTGGTIQGVYATGAVTSSSDRVGGLVGTNELGTVQGAYATGAVTGNNNVGGLVGTNAVGTVVGAYARGNVTRIVGSALTPIGRLVGFNESGTATGYHSGQAGESQLLSMAADGTSTPLTGATGIDGTARTSASAQADFTGFDFTTDEIGQWIYTAGRWPALNLGDLQSAAEQPTQ